MGTVSSKSVDKRPKGKDGRPIVRADSRPEDSTTYFTTKGDDTGIGNGKAIIWDFSNNDDEVTDSITTSVPSGMKRKRMKLSFADEVRIKEGSLYWENAPFGTFVDFWVICPDGEYYINRGTGQPAQASGDTPLVHYVNHHMIMGDCPMGDELNTEAANEDPIPSNFELWVEVTIDENNTDCHGAGELEIYRTRTYLHPGESL